MHYVTFKWLQVDSNAEPFSSLTTIQPFGQTDQIIELCSEYLSLRCNWLYVLFISHTLFRDSVHSILPKCQGNPCLKKARNVKFKWLQLDLNTEPFTSYTNAQSLGWTDQMIELCSEYLSVRCNWLYILINSRTRFRVNPHSLVAWMSRNFLIEADT